VFLRHCAPTWQSRWLGEVANECDVKVGAANTTWQEMIDLHIAVAERVHSDLPGGRHLIGGPTAAYPQYQLRNFSNFATGMGQFIALAGPSIDFLSLHLYDSYQPDMDSDPGDYSPRSGNNLDAVLDLNEAYSYNQLGRVLPQLVSEYGSSFKVNNFTYSPTHDWFILRGVNSKLLQFLERPDRLLKAIPFIVGKATWYPTMGEFFYPFTLWHLEQEGYNGKDQQWVETHLGKFYQLWERVTGSRVKATSSDANIQVAAFLSSQTLFVCLNNVRNNTARAVISLPAFGSSAQVNVSRLFYNASTMTPQLDQTLFPMPTAETFNVSFLPEETAIFSFPLPSRALAPTTIDITTFYGSPTMVAAIPGSHLLFNMSAANLSGGSSRRQTIDHGFVRVSFSQQLQSATESVVYPSFISVDGGSPLPVEPALQSAGRNMVDVHTLEFFGSLRVALPAATLLEMNTGDPAGKKHMVHVAFPEKCPSTIVASVVLQTAGEQVELG